MSIQEPTTQALYEHREPGEELQMLILVIAVLVVPIAVMLPWRRVNVPKPILIVMAVAIGLACAKFALEEFHKLLILYAAYAPFSKELAGDFDRFLPAFNLTNIFLVFMFISWLAKSVIRREKLYTRHRLDIMLAMFMLLSSLSLMRARSFDESGSTIELVLQLKRWLFPMVLYFITVNNLKKREHLRWLLISVCITTAVVSVMGLKEYYVDKNAGASLREIKKRIGVGSGPNNLGAFFCYYAPFILASFLYNMNILRAWLTELPAFIFASQAMRLTFSRGAQVAYAAGLLLCLFLRKKTVFIFLLFPLLVLVVINPGSMFERFLGRLNKTYNSRLAADTGSFEGGLDKSSRDRIAIWRGGVQIVRDHPVAGVGYKNFSKEIGRYLGYKRDYVNRDPHNTYLSIAAEMGIPALLVFLLVMAKMFMTGIHVFRKTDDKLFKTYALGYVGGMVGLLVSNIFGSRLDSAEITAQFWILTGGMYVIRDFVDGRLPTEEVPDVATADGQGQEAAHGSP